MMKKYRKHLAEILIEVGMVDPIAMGSMLSEHRETQTPLSSILVDHGLTTMKLLSYVMEQEYEFKHIDMERYTVPAKVSHVFTQLQKNLERGLPIELYPLPKSDFDMERWVIDNDGCKGEPIVEQQRPLVLTIVSEDDFYNYVTDSRKQCMMCMNPLIIKNANSCYRLKKLTDKAKEANIQN